MIGTFIENHPDEKGILLLPMLQCRGYAHIVSREHIVLVEVNLNNHTIAVHDSQSKTRYAFYPDKLKDIAKSLHFQYTPSKDYHAYDKQSDEDLCGWYVHQYLMTIINQGSSEYCGIVSLNKDKFANKQQYLRDFLGDKPSEENSHLDQYADDDDDFDDTPSKPTKP